MTTSNQINAETIARAQKRVKGMRDAALLDWADAAAPGVMRHLDYYRRTKDGAHLTEASIAVWQLQLVLDQLIENYLAQQEEGLTPDSSL